MSFSPASPEAGSLFATVVAIKRAINPFTPSTSMNSLRPKSENGLPLRWATYTVSSTSMWLPFPVGKPSTHASCTWMTARSSTSARRISPGRSHSMPSRPVERSSDPPEVPRSRPSRETRRAPACFILHYAPGDICKCETPMPDVFLTHLAAGIGTSGTLTGAGRRLRAFNAGSQIAAVLEPPAS
jgi:hypothetical protein